tara:strand:+ start:12755 stop:13039 length:285 start_codon:yes stop_codon:yes gene_type:complete
MINLWEYGVQERIVSGELIVPCGTWVSCGAGRPSRFIGTTGVTLNVAHYPNTGGAKFASRVAFHKASIGSKLNSKQAAIIAAVNPTFFKIKGTK